MDPISLRLNPAPTVREIEVLRIAGTLKSFNHSITVADARAAILRWAQKRRGAKLPLEASKGEPFEYLAGGRYCAAVRLQSPPLDLWAFRADDPDKTVAGRVWTTEMVIGRRTDEPPRFSARLFAATTETSLDIDIAVPGFVRQIANGGGLLTGNNECVDHAWWVANEVEIASLIEQLVDPTRLLPLVIITTGEQTSNITPLTFSPDDFAAATIGIAHVAVIPEHLTWYISDAFGRSLAVFNGGIRVYQPGFTSDDDPYGAHDLILSREIPDAAAAYRALCWLKGRLASTSVKRVRLGSNTISYQDVRAASIKHQQRELEIRGGSNEDKLLAASARIESLETQRKSDTEWQSTLETDNQILDRRAKSLEALVNSSKQRIAQLTAILDEQGRANDAGLQLPDSWDRFATWCDESFPGRLILSGRARRSMKDAEFEDVEIAARALIWLAGPYRTARLEGGEGSLRDYVIEPGIRNSPCGSDSYQTKWKDENRSIDWHVKNGGNTRDPKRCFRAYYFWDKSSEQIVIDFMPSHLTTGAS